MFSLRKFGLIVAAIALANLAGCGQFGRLYLPDQPQPRPQAQTNAKDGSQDSAQDSEFNAQPPALDKSRQP